MKNLKIKFKIYPVKLNFYFTGSIFLAIIFFSVFIFIPHNAEAKDLFVSTTGSDATSYAGNDIDHPWLTPAKGWYNAQAGDTVYFRGGTYNIASMINTNTPNGYDGTLSNPITFTTYSTEEVIFNATAGSGSAMFQISKNYNIVKNFTINAGNFYNRVFAVGWYDGDKAVTGFTAENLTISNWVDGDNSNAFYIGSSYAEVTADEIIIKDCRLTGRPDAVNQNYTGIQVFGATDFSIENNELSQMVKAVHIKHSSYGVIDHDDVIKNNYIHSLNAGGVGIQIHGNYVDVLNNIVSGKVHFGEDAESGSNPNGTYINWNHNTIIDTIEQLYDGGGIHATFTNNIFGGTAYIFRYSGDPENPQIDETNYNLYNSSAVTHKGATYSLVNWITHMVSDGTGGNRDANSISGTATYIGGETPVNIAGFALTPESYGYQSCLDGSDIGADVSLVGVDAGAESDTTAPSAPSGLSVS